MNDPTNRFDPLAAPDEAPSQTAAPEPPTPRPRKRHRLRWLALLLFIVFPAAVVIWYMVTIYPTLPDARELKEVRYQVPLRILTRDSKLIAEIGTQKRIPLDYTQIPERMTQAIIAAEDENFFSHPGVDPKGLARALYQLITTGEKKSGGSTITMQVARNFFLTREKTFLRKLNEIVLALKIEHQLTKPEILALYLNKIFLGHRSYGVAAAARTYYGKNIDELTLDEYAMLAGLPKAPSAY
ncbi:MAG TPA: peptidase, partial [Piscirickettsiaceae bacterium]|nr:peptidase [Piscirickettsiaceae bacterium]